MKGDNIMSQIQNVICKLGYDKSENLIYSPNFDECKQLTWHDRRVIKELSPYAIYIVDDRALVAFFDDLHVRTSAKIQSKIWNAQLPVIISDEGDKIKIYNGKYMKVINNDLELHKIKNYSINQCDESNDFSYWNVTNSLKLGLYEKNLGKNKLNDFLIDNLKYITQELKNNFKISFANKLMLRIIFIRYLIDRGINIGYGGLSNDVVKSQQGFLNIVKDKEKLFSLFRYLKTKFNGNLFEMDEQSEKEEICEDSLALLNGFLSGQEELKTGQLCLFSFYDFNIIPIELISNIYEILLGKEKQNDDKAFYTPEFLADYIVEQTVSNYLYGHDECTVFDPSCGSGIFLVKSLRKILEKKASAENGFIHNKMELNNIVERNIFGVDYNEEAVDVTIFSLYVTLFDYQDPKNLKDFKLPLLKNKNIVFGDFFDVNTLKKLKQNSFKFVLGNPPWGKVGQKLYKKYAQERNVTLPEGEICVAFLLKVQEMFDEKTECSLVIPSKILYKGKSPSVKFRQMFFSNIELQHVLELSALRKQIFKGATAPATILSFKCKKPSNGCKFEYISLKPNKYLKLFDIIMITPTDVKFVEQNMLSKNDKLWRILVYGGYWDFELLEELSNKMKTVRSIEKECDLIQGKGIQDHRGDGKDSSHLIGKKLLNSDGSIEHFQLKLDNLDIFSKSEIHRPRNKDLFKPPYVFFKKGLDCNDLSVRAVYSEEALVYKETINCIKGTMDNKDVLLNLTGLLNSSLFSYFNLMMNSSAGIEREQVFLKEIEKFPYAYSDKLVELVEKIQLATKTGKSIKELKDELNDCVLDMYKLKDNYFIDYALNIQIPIFCGKYIETECTIEIMKKYAQIFIDIWTSRLDRIGLKYIINIYPNIKGKFAAFELQFVSDATNNSVNVVENIDDNIETLTKFMIYKVNDCFYQFKNVAEFNEDSIIILKSIESKNWHPAIAFKDSYDVLNSVLREEGD